VANCVTYILQTYSSEFPVAGHGYGTANQVIAAVKSRPSFQYVQLDLVKSNVAELNEMELDRISLIMQRYINSMLSYNLIDGIPQRTSNNGFPFLFVDEIQDKGTTLQIDVLWVGHEHVENYIKKKSTPTLPSTPPGADDKDF